MPIDKCVRRVFVCLASRFVCLPSSLRPSKGIYHSLEENARSRQCLMRYGSARDPHAQSLRKPPLDFEQHEPYKPLSFTLVLDNMHLSLGGK